MNDETTATEPLAARCAQHRDVETYLRCGRCDTPICPRCLVQTPVGARCRSCARLRKLPIYDVGPRFLLRGGAAGVAAAVMGGFVLQFLPNFGLLLSLVLGAAYGYAVAGGVSAGTNRKRGRSLGWITVLAIFLGFSLSRAVLAYVQLSSMPDAARLGRALLVGFNPDLGSIALMGIAALVAYNQLR